MSTLLQFVDLLLCDKDSVTASDEREGKNQTICCSSKRRAYKWQQNVNRAANSCMFVGALILHSVILSFCWTNKLFRSYL